jgi:hypothetical protein
VLINGGVTGVFFAVAEVIGLSGRSQLGTFARGPWDDPWGAHIRYLASTSSMVHNRHEMP